MKPEEKTNIFLQAMSMENSLLQSYRALFIAIEAALIAMAFGLSTLFDNKWIELVGLGGLVIGIMWIIVCHAKGKEVDGWRDQLTTAARQARVGCFSYLESGFGLGAGRVARCWFNWIMPILIMWIWICVIVYGFSV